MYLLLHFLSYRKGKREGIPQRRPWGMVDGALTPWLIDVAHVDTAGHQCGCCRHGSHRLGCHRCGCRRCDSRQHCWASMWLLSTCLTSTWLSSTWLPSMQLALTWLMWMWRRQCGVCQCGCWGSRWLTSSCPLLCIDSPPCPTSLSHLLLILLFLCPFNLGVRGRCWRGVVDLAGVDVAALTCPGWNRRGMADVDMVCGVVDVVCGMWSTGSVVDVAWSTGVVMNAHIPQHEYTSWRAGLHIRKWGKYVCLLFSSSSARAYN